MHNGFNVTRAKQVAEREEQGTVISVKDETGKPLTYVKKHSDGAIQAKEQPVTIVVAGTYSKRYRKLIEAQRDKLLEQKVIKTTGKRLLQQQIELVAGSILAWDGFFIDDEGTPFELNEENATVLLTECPWVREQIEEAMGDHAGFFKNA